MNGTQAQTVYSGLANQPGMPRTAYDGVTPPQEATDSPKYEENRPGLRSPYPPPKYVPPPNLILI
jgi:hypothetical protein